MDKILHNTPVFKMKGKFDSDKEIFIYSSELVCADVYKISVGKHSRLICAFKKQNNWFPLDVLTGITLPGYYTTKTEALQALKKYFEEFLDPKFPYIRINRIENLHQMEKDLFKVLDENQKVCYNKLVDLCEN
jgi:hypothetical protein